MTICENEYSTPMIIGSSVTFDRCATVSCI